MSLRSVAIKPVSSKVSLTCSELLLDSPSTSTISTGKASLENLSLNSTTTTATRPIAHATRHATGHHAGYVAATHGAIAHQLHHQQHGVTSMTTRRRSARNVLQPTTHHINTLAAGNGYHLSRRTSHVHSQVVINSRKRQSTEQCLNTAQHLSVSTLQDVAIHCDQRVLSNLFAAEEKAIGNAHYFSAVQDHIEPYHRAQAVEWILDVAKEEKCDPDVFPLAVSLIDRFLSVQNIFKKDIQVLAGVCLFVASKLKAPQPINAARISFYTADSVSTNDIISWELLLLANLNWQLVTPTAFDFYDQLVVRFPSLYTVKDDFIHTVHKMQRNYKLAMIYPSLQCSIALMFVSNGAAGNLWRDVQNAIDNCFAVQPNLLLAYMPTIASVVSDGAVAPQVCPAAPPSSSNETTSFESGSGDVSFSALCNGALPADPKTPSGSHLPFNDSGFCSGLSSPETNQFGAVVEEDSGSPPKMPRLAV